MRRIIYSLVFAAVALGALPLISTHAQSLAPVVLQAESPAPATTAAPSPSPSPASPSASSQTMLQRLQEMQATNAATIKKQEAALETLDALQKAAEEIKIYSKRG